MKTRDAVNNARARCERGREREREREENLLAFLRQLAFNCGLRRRCQCTRRERYSSVCGFCVSRAERIYLDQLSGRFSSIGYLFIAELPERAAGDIYCLLNSGFYGGWEKRDGATLEKELLFLARGRVCAKRVYC